MRSFDNTFQYKFFQSKPGLVSKAIIPQKLLQTPVSANLHRNFFNGPFKGESKEIFIYESQKDLKMAH